ncbi:MAG: glycosyltransferase family 39 protein [Acidobacteria bacterium]|nr:glycosyltransferase family 39 protein [Acidobacteriota bacterium]
MQATLLVLAISAIATIVRFRGLGYGLPAIYNPDEIAILTRSLSFATGTLNPHNFLYPTFFFYALCGWIGGWFLVRRIGGSVASVRAFEMEFFTDPSNIYFAGRSLVALCGTLTVPAVYGLARQVAGRGAAIAAALFLASAPLHARDSHYIKHDVPAALIVTIALTAILGLDRRAQPARRDLVPAAAFCGVALATHYYTIFLLVPLAIAIWRKGRVGRTRLLPAAALTVAVVFAMLSPFVLLEPLIAWRDMTANRDIVVGRALEQDTAFLPSAGRYVEMLALEATAWPIAVLAMIGVGWTIAARPRGALLLLSFAVPFFLFVSHTVPATRYLVPLVPVMSVFAGVATDRIAGLAPGSLRRWVFVALCVAAAAPAFGRSLETDRFLRQDDTRTIAQRFIERSAAPGSTILVQPYSVQLVQSRRALREALRANLGDERRASVRFQKGLVWESPSRPAYRLLYLGDGGLDVDKIYVHYAEVRTDAALTHLRALGVDYVVLKRTLHVDPAIQPLQATLEHQARRIASFTPYKEEVSSPSDDVFLHNTDASLSPELARPGPIIDVWKID